MEFPNEQKTTGGTYRNNVVCSWIWEMRSAELERSQVSINQFLYRWMADFFSFFFSAKSQHGSKNRKSVHFLALKKQTTCVPIKCAGTTVAGGGPKGSPFFCWLAQRIQMGRRMWCVIIEGEVLLNKTLINLYGMLLLYNARLGLPIHGHTISQ